MLTILISVAMAVDYVPINGTHLHDNNRDGMIILPSGLDLSVPLFKGAPITVALPTGMARAEDDTLVAWGAFRDASAGGGAVDGLMWMMLVIDGEPTLHVAMDRGLEVGTLSYGGQSLLVTATRFDKSTTSTPMDWLPGLNWEIGAYWTLLQSEVPVVDGTDASVACNQGRYDATRPSGGTLQFHGFTGHDQYRHEVNRAYPESTKSMGSVLLALGGCSEPTCHPGRITRCNMFQDATPFGICATVRDHCCIEDGKLGGNAQTGYWCATSCTSGEACTDAGLDAVLRRFVAPRDD